MRDEENYLEQEETTNHISVLRRTELSAVDLPSILHDIGTDHEEEEVEEAPVSAEFTCCPF